MSDQDVTDTEDQDVDDDKSSDEEYTPPSAEEWQKTQDEVNRLKRTAADASRKAKDAERAAKAAAEEKAKKDGDWQKVAEEKEREAAEARQEADEATGKLASYEQQTRVTTAASALNFRDPQDAHRFLSAEEMNDDKLTDAALKRLKKSKPYLIADTRRSGVDGEDDGEDSGLTPEQKHARWLASKF